MCDPRIAPTKHLVVIDARFPEGQGHAFHYHPGQEEVIYVVAGEIEQWVGEEKHRLGPGDTAFIPADKVHATYTVGKAEARIIAVLSPAIGETGFSAVDVSGDAPWREMRKA
jgi:quercetin dioxygenase-like cupin family protein